MAKAVKSNGILGKALGASLALSAAFAPVVADAQDVTPAAMSLETVDTILCETDREYYAKDNWTPEIADLDCASDGAREYAENNNGVGILVHVGQDIPNSHFATADQFGQTIVAVFQQKYGTDAQYFLSQNDALATGVTFHIDDLIHGADNGTEVKNVKDALAAMPEIVGLLKMVKAQELAQLQGLETPEPGG